MKFLAEKTGGIVVMQESVTSIFKYYSLILMFLEKRIKNYLIEIKMAI